eukprot:3517230-Amphidinium_carterae.1
MPSHRWSLARSTTRRQRCQLEAVVHHQADGEEVQRNAWVSRLLPTRQGSHRRVSAEDHHVHQE